MKGVQSTSSLMQPARTSLTPEATNIPMSQQQTQSQLQPSPLTLAEKMSLPTKEQAIVKLKCFLCGEEGHAVKDCKSDENNTNNHDSTAANNANNSAVGLEAESKQNDDNIEEDDLREKLQQFDGARQSTSASNNTTMHQLSSNSHHTDQTSPILVGEVSETLQKMDAPNQDMKRKRHQEETVSTLSDDQSLADSNNSRMMKPVTTKVPKKKKGRHTSVCSQEDVSQQLAPAEVFLHDKTNKNPLDFE
ncbi:hypothetical protein QAD02_013919 [Eretmocerus hayati]|uniref:Uncharacterized protein n=1 Tax=Eretmocerus hayati TaxID=131215 RepID=A0ACC2P6N2_9HYME|nr:hypothetical protein QAD02_013919 [Eretmocerus hayati]